MNLIKGAAAIVALGTLFGASQADATSFSMNIYNFNAGGEQANAAATAANVSARLGDLVAQITYTGELNFEVDAANGLSTIGQFLDSGPGSFTIDNAVNPGFLDLILSSGAGSSQPSFGTTTFFDITATFPASFGFSGVISHDDGISLFDDGVLVTVASAAPPTVEIDTPYSFGGGEFRLIYAAANGDPSVLRVTGVQAVPLPAPALLLISALAGLALMRRRAVAAA